MHYKNLRWLSIAGIVIILDQLTKIFVFTHIDMHQVVQICPWLNIILSYNTGAAFSFLAGHSGWQQWLLGTVAILISSWIIFSMLRTDPKHRGMFIAFSLIVGGALSNVIDRIWHGFVIDFIDFHINTWHYATFNVADSAITLGAILLVILVMLKKV